MELISILAILLLCLLAFITSFCIFFDGMLPPNHWSNIVIRFFSGLVLLSTGYAVLKMLGLNGLLILIVPVVTSAILLKASSFQVLKFNNNNNNKNAKKLLTHFVIFVLLNGNLFLQGFDMGLGDFPKEFYNVDSAAYLSLLQSFLRSKVYPPQSLDILGNAFKYHFGSVSMAALISQFTMLTAHAALFIVLPIICSLAIYALAYKFSDIITKEKGPYLFISTAVTILLLRFEFASSFIPSRFYHSLFLVEHFGKKFPMLSSITGTFVCLLSIYIAFTAKSFMQLLSLVLIFPFLPFFKIPYFPIPLCGISVFVLYKAYEQHKSVYIMVPIMLFSFTALVYFLLCFEPASNGIIRSPEDYIQIIFNDKYIIQLLFAFLVFFIPIAVLLVERKLIPKDRVVMTAILVLGSVAGGTFFFIDDPNYSQFYTNTMVFFLFLLIPVFIKLATKPRFGKIILISVALPCLLVLFSDLYYFQTLLFNKPAAHEYCNNRSIACALKAIPVANSILITNDLRYPANNYSRDIKQFQLSSLFGHQVYFSNTYFLTQASKNQLQRMEKYLKLLHEPSLDSIFYKMVKEDGITHLLIHETYLKPDTVPLTKIFSNSEYSVYEIKSSSKETYPVVR